MGDHIKVDDLIKENVIDRVEKEETIVTEDLKLKTMTKEEFADYILGTYAVSVNREIKEIRSSIETCFRIMQKFAFNREAQKNILKSVILKILNDEKLSEEETKVFELHYIQKKFLRSPTEYVLKHIIMDLIYSCYDFNRTILVASVQYIDKISNFINEN